MEATQSWRIGVVFLSPVTYSRQSFATSKPKGLTMGWTLGFSNPMRITWGTHQNLGRKESFGPLYINLTLLTAKELKVR